MGEEGEEGKDFFRFPKSYHDHDHEEKVKGVKADLILAARKVATDPEALTLAIDQAMKGKGQKGKRKALMSAGELAFNAANKAADKLKQDHLKMQELLNNQPTLQRDLADNKSVYTSVAAYLRAYLAKQEEQAKTFQERKLKEEAQAEAVDAQAEAVRSRSQAAEAEAALAEMAVELDLAEQRQKAANDYLAAMKAIDDAHAAAAAARG